jgi:hypothetical protein
MRGKFFKKGAPRMARLFYFPPTPANEDSPQL